MTNSQIYDKRPFILLFSVFAISYCALIYQLLIGSVSSYFVGDSITQFSLTIGFFMTGMGIGSYLSRFIKSRLLWAYINIEIILGFVGGVSVPVLYAAFAFTSFFNVIMLLVTLIIGTFIGLEIPLLTRILSNNFDLRFNLSNVLSLDYLGALFATVMFPFILLPLLGTFRTALVFGLLNIAIGLGTYFMFKSDIKKESVHSKDNVLYLFSFFFASALALGIFYSSYLMQFWNDTVFSERVILSQKSQYQDIVLTSKNKMLNMYLNGNLQFSSVDEYRYHEALVLFPAERIHRRKNVLILGGGDGLAAKEVLKYKDVESVILVDIDPMVTTLSKTHKIISKLNQDSLKDKRVQIINEDAFNFIVESDQFFDLIISDLPDPNNLSLAKLYSVQFYRLIQRRLSKNGIFVTQATNAIQAKDAFWCIKKTISESGFQFIDPYHLHVPSFGEWGFIMASNVKLPMPEKISVDTKFLNIDIISSLLNFPKDSRVNLARLDVSTLDRPNVVSYYLKGWEYWR